MIAKRMAFHNFFGSTLSLFLPLCFIPFVIGHVRVYHPASRGSLWRFGFNASRPSYNEYEGFCGGSDVMYNKFNGKCGVCGDPWLPRPRLHERGGKYFTGEPTGYFKSGGYIDSYVDIIANHGGYLEFKLCPYDNPKPGDLELYENGTMVEVSQSCLDRYVLPVGDKREKKYYIQSYQEKGFITGLSIFLPNIRCRKCLFQWRYKAANKWGVDSNGNSCLGCGKQEEFRGCADIAIGYSDKYTPPPTTDKTVTTKKTCRFNKTTVTRSTVTTVPTKTCHPTMTYINVPKMKNWCNINCNRGFCPKSHCVCTTR